MRVGFEWCKAGSCSHMECITIRGGSLRSVQFPSYFGKIYHPDHGWILYDTGYSSHFYSETRPFPERFYSWVTPVQFEPKESAAEQLKAEGIQPEEVNWILISHFHGDHVAGLKDFPNARFICFESAYTLLKKRSRFKNISKGYLNKLVPENFELKLQTVESSSIVRLNSNMRPFEIGYDLFKDESLIAVPLNGHAQGQMGLILKTNEDKQLFLVADAVWNSENFKSLRFPHPITKLISHNSKEYIRTIKDLHFLSSNNPELLIVPSHCREFKPGVL